MFMNLLSMVLCLLVALPGAFGNGEGASIENARKALEPLDKEFDAARARLNVELADMRKMDAYKEARKERDREKTRELTEQITAPFYKMWRERYRKASAGYVGSEGELAFADSMLSKRLVEDPGALLRRVVTAHVKSPHLLPIAKGLWRFGFTMPKDEYRALLERVIDENPLVEIQAYCYYARAMPVRYDRNASAADRKRADADMAKVIETMPADSILSMRARGPEFAKTRLQIGQEVPDIEGVDLDGEKFKLSDYRGKVVVLDFWGHW